MNKKKNRKKSTLCGNCHFFCKENHVDQIIFKTDKPDEETFVAQCRKVAPKAFEKSGSSGLDTNITRLNGWPLVHPYDWCGDHKLNEDGIEES